ncbi:MAG: NADH-ubiquinone oxidoreductase chain 6 [Flaviaesturariibacter sp.]|nr:NADH-ubiquinone oxidoreductase chain 6 [Flaviaesturariibacter sp.]
MQKLSLLRRIPLHSFLIGLYIISFIYVRNISQVSPVMVYRSALISLFISGILFGFSYLFYRSSRKAGILTTLFVIGFFIYGAIYEYLDGLFYKGYWPFEHIHRILIAVYFILYFLIFLLLFRSKRPHNNINYTLNIFVLVLLCFNTFLAINPFKAKKANEEVTNNYIRKEQNYIGSLAKDSMPDVYYIILDGYASEHTIKQYYKGQSSVLYNYLREKNFYIADSSQSNYPVTKFSLSSSLNMDYLKDMNPVKTKNLVEQNLVSYIFRQNNYRVVNVESGYAVTQKFDFAHKTIKVGGLNEFERRLLELTILRIDDVLGIEDYSRTKSLLNKMHLVTKEVGPKFSFIHIVSPHPPYVFDKNGNQRKNSSLSDKSWEPKEHYADQLEYISLEIIKLVDDILRASKIKPIIIFQSDHGPLLSDSNAMNVFDARMHILNAYYMPEQYKSRLYKSISPVNSFRLLTSELFHLNFPLLQDSTISFSSFCQEPTFKLYIQGAKN